MADLHYLVFTNRPENAGTVLKFCGDAIRPRLQFCVAKGQTRQFRDAGVDHGMIKEMGSVTKVFNSGFALANRTRKAVVFL